MSVTGTNGGGIDPALVFALTSSDDVVHARVLELRQAQKDAEDAFLALRIGNDAAKVYDEVAALKTELTKKILSADSERCDLIAAAGETANEIRAAAEKYLEDAKERAEKIVAEAQAVSGQLISDAEAKWGEVEDAQRMVDSLTDAVHSREEATAAIMAEAQAGIASGEAMRKKSEALIYRLKAAMEG